MRDIYLIPNGGLGNQLFQFACALNLADGGKIYLLSEWGNARRNSVNEIELSNLDLGPQVSFDSKPVSTLLRRWLNLLLRLSADGHFFLGFINLVSFFLSGFISIRLGRILNLKVGRGLGYSKIRAQGNLLLLGYFQSYRWSDEILEQLLKLSTKSISSKAKNLITQIQNEEILMIHVRRGDYKNEDFGILGDTFYVDALDAHREREYDVIWVFSDELELAKEIPVLRSNPKVLFIDDSQLGSCEILEIMRRGSGFIIANSSFSWWAATLRERRDALVVCPKPWFKNNHSPTEINDPSWVSIPW